MRCLPATAGCAAAGFPCSVDEQCCGGLCLPDGAGGYACSDTCAPAGARCNAPQDCCTGSCAGSSGAAVCVPAPGTIPDPICGGAGQACEGAGDSCCAGTACSEVSGGSRACAAPEPS